MIFLASDRHRGRRALSNHKNQALARGPGGHARLLASRFQDFRGGFTTEVLMTTEIIPSHSSLSHW